MPGTHRPSEPAASLPTHLTAPLAAVTAVAALLGGAGLITNSPAPGVSAGSRAALTAAVAQAATLPGGSVRVPVSVPASMRTSPFDVTRYLNVPAGFSASVFARVSGARFLAVAPNGDLLVSQPNPGVVKLLRPSPTGGDPQVFDFATGLRKPHDIVFHRIGTTTYIYIAESHQINRYVYNTGDTAAHSRQVVVAGLPDSSNPELQGTHGHQLKNIALDSANNLYISSASATNASESDVLASPPRAAILQYNADGSGGRVFARGLRNAEGLAMLPGSNELWVVVNNRDNIAYPFHNDWNGDGTDDYGKVMQSYVDNHPPEEFTRVRDGGNYGWPYANPNPDTPAGLDDMPFDLDVQTNPTGAKGAADSFDRITKGIQAHSAPLGLTFLQNTNFPGVWRNGALTALHGSWNRAQRTGYKLAYFPWIDATNRPGAQVDLVAGWLDSGTVWGRPVDAAVSPDGALYVSDDHSGTIYKLTYTGAQGTGTGLTGEYFDSIDFTAPAGTRTDATVNFDWGNGAPDPAMGVDTFSVRWTGEVQPLYGEAYTFHVTSDDCVRLWVDDVLIVDQWNDHPPTTYASTPIQLTAARKHKIRMEFYERGVGAVAKLAWSSPSQPLQTVPATQLYPAPAGAGTGLKATYWDNIDFTGASSTRTEATVNFDWGTGRPSGTTLTSSDTFSARWEGKVKAPVGGAYVFTTRSDDGVRLWVNGQLVVNNWTDHAPTNNSSAAVTLTAGQLYDVKMEFYERGGGAVAKLSWSYPGQATQIIPQAALYPAP